jgi:predicted ATP-dependent endonuclease of OLD family
MIVEGDAEMILIPNMVKKVFGSSLDELGVSLINMNSTVFQNIAKIFHEGRIQRRCAIITDLDKSIYALPEDPDNDNDDQRKSRNAEMAGELRRRRLESFCAENKWLNVYYANHTFEVDFLLNDNSHEIVDTLDSIYTRRDDIRRSSKLLNDDNLEVSGKEVLRLAEKVGKGWFALMVAEKVNSYTFIPDYILCALAFASSEIISDSTIRAMGLYRLKKRKRDSEFKPVYQKIRMLKKLPQDEFIKKYAERLPEDQLTKFINFIIEEHDAV